MPNVGFIGIAGSGKTHAITLLGITTVELTIKNLIHSYIDEGKLRLHEYMERLRSGQVLEPTNPNQLTMGCKIHVSYPKWGGLARKKATITPLDTSGEILRVVMELIPDVKTINDLIKEIRERTSMDLTQRDINDIQDFILSADGYILVVDAFTLLSRSAPQDRINQNLNLIRFMRQLREFRERVKLTPVRGLAVLLTKVDQITEKVTEESDVKRIIEKWSPGLYTEIKEVMNRGGRVGYFYSWLKVEVDEYEGEGRRVYVRTVENKPIYSQDQYEKLLWWIRDTF